MIKHAIFRLGLIALAVPAFAGSPEPLDAYLHEGRIKDGLAAYAKPADNAGYFSLAVLQALDGVQQFSSGMNHLGLRKDFIQSNLPFFRIARPGAPVDSKETATPEKVAKIFGDFRAALRRANATVTRVDEKDFGVEVNLSQARLDFDGDGKVARDDLLINALGQGFVSPTRAPDGGEIVVRFDSADAMWLKGYTHFLPGTLDVFMSYDWQPVWNQCAHLLFMNPEPAPPMAAYLQGRESFAEWADLIAAVHDMRLKLIDKDGPRRARDEFKSMISSSRTCWQRILAETDDNKEWLPSPKQSGPGGSKITQVQVDGWLSVLDELDAVASGKKLLPHWRIKDGVGINVEKFVNSPPSLDLVLLIQGSAFVPYLEQGPVSDKQTWTRLTRVFDAGFFRYAVWSN